MAVFRSPVAVMLFATLGAAQSVGAKLAHPVKGDQYMDTHSVSAPLVTEGLVQAVKGGVYSGLTGAQISRGRVSQGAKSMP